MDRVFFESLAFLGPLAAALLPRSTGWAFFAPLAVLGALACARLLITRRALDRAFFGLLAFLGPLAWLRLLVTRGTVAFAIPDPTLGPTRLLIRATAAYKAMPPWLKKPSTVPKISLH